MNTNRNIKPSCRGFTLVETLVVIATTSILMGVAITLLHGVARWGQSAQHHADATIALDRLEQSLRTDLRTATKVAADDKTLTIQASNNTKSVYTLTPAACGLARTTPKGAHQEQYQIGPAAGWKAEVTEASPSRLATIEIEWPADMRSMPFRVVAGLPAQEDLK